MKSANYVYEKDVLPIINAVHRHPALTTLHSSFCNVTDDLNLKIIECFGHELDIDWKSTRLNSSHGAKSRMPSSA